MNSEEKDNIRLFIRNKEEYISICKEESWSLGDKVSKKYSEFLDLYEEYYRKVSDAGFAAAGAVVAYKTHKVDPFIAGGAASAIGGAGLGAYSALSANERNKKIESARQDAVAESRLAQARQAWAEEKLLKAYYELKDLLDSCSGIKEMDYNTGQAYLQDNQFEQAAMYFNRTRNYKDTEAALVKVAELRAKYAELRAEEKRKERTKYVILICGNVLGFIMIPVGAFISPIVTVLGFVLYIGAWVYFFLKQFVLPSFTVKSNKERTDKTKANINKIKEKFREKKALIIGAVVSIVVVVVAVILFASIGVPKIKQANAYNEAVSMFENGDYYSAKDIFESLDGYKEAQSYIEECDIRIIEIKNKKIYDEALLKLNSGDYDGAIEDFSALQDFLDSGEQLIKAKQMKYDKALEYKAKEDVASKEKALNMFLELENFSYSRQMASETKKEMYILEFCTADYDENKVNKATKATEYFIDNANCGIFKTLSSEEIENNIIGTWEKFPYNQYYATHVIVTFNEDGSIGDSTSEWKVENDHLITLFSEYYIVQIDDNHLLLFIDYGKQGVVFNSLYVRK